VREHAGGRGITVKIATMEMQIVAHTVISVLVVNVERNRVLVQNVLQMTTVILSGAKDLTGNWDVVEGAGKREMLVQPATMVMDSAVRVITVNVEHVQITTEK